MVHFQEKMIEDKMILVCYDLKDNMTRAKFREQLTSYPFYGKMMTESVYYLPETIASLRAVRKFANSIKLDHSSDQIVVFGDVNTKLKDQKKLVIEYVTHLQEIVHEVDSTTERIRDELLEFEENIHLDEIEVMEKQSNGKMMKVIKQNNLRGWATKVSSIRNRFEEIRTMINKVGDKHDEFELDKISSLVDKLDERFERVKVMKDKINKEKKKNK